MLERLHKQKKVQLAIGLFIGFCFGFLLQKGGVTRYDYIMNQLLLRDWTVVQIILTAIATGMVGVYFLRSEGLAQLHKKSGSFGATVIGGLIFGVGFGLLGYCPGTMAGAAAQGSIDALLGGVLGMLVGVGIYAAMYGPLSQTVLKVGEFGEITLPQLLKWRTWPTIAVACGVIVLVLVATELFFSNIY